MTVHLQTDTVTVHHGDSLEVLRSLPDASVDACVTDPPYGLAEHPPASIAAVLAAWLAGNRAHVPDGRGFMGRTWDAFVPPPALWDECLRVLKPGGHLLSFAGSRTADLMGISIRLAGFEIRETITWHHAQGFPKSLDVSKAIDKSGGSSPDNNGAALRQAREMAGLSREQIAELIGCSSTSVRDWEDGRARTAGGPVEICTPSPAYRAELVELFRYAGEANRETIGERTTGRGTGRGDVRYIADSKNRAITAPATDDARRWQGWGTALKPASEPIVCAQKPLNPVPFEWRLAATVHHALAGLMWLSLAPARRAEALSKSKSHVPDGAWCASALVSAATVTSPDVSVVMDTYSSPALASTCSNIARSWNDTLAALSGPTTTSTTSTRSSTIIALKTLNSLLGPLTSQITMPLCDCLDGGPRSSAPSAAPDSNGAWTNWLDTLSVSVPETAIEGIALAVSNALASVAEDLSLGPAAGRTAPRPAPIGQQTTDGASWPASANTAERNTSPAGTVADSAHFGAPGSPSVSGCISASEPIVVARKPLAGTVAQTVLTHGTGALNIDACRVGGGGQLKWSTPRGMGSESSFADDAWTQAQGRPPADRTANGVGRWPSNVVFSHAGVYDPDSGDLVDGCADGCAEGCPVAELDAQSGVLTSGANPTRRGSDKFRDAYGEFKGQAECAPARGADSGGASRFFPTFRYQAKAPPSERPKVDGTAHPTVKPVNLMRWLVRLVTPPGGTVVEPFAGSGTTVEACLLEGFRCVAVERSGEYLPLIGYRVARAGEVLASVPVPNPVPDVGPLPVGVEDDVPAGTDLVLF